MRRYSPPYHSPPRRGYGGRGRSPPRRGYSGGYGGRREQNNGSLLVRNIPLNCRPEDLRVPFERYGPVRDVYMPKDYYTGEITVVVAAETRKKPEEMRTRDRQRGPSGYDSRRSYGRRRSRSLSRSRSPRSRHSRQRSRSHSPAPRRRGGDYSVSPRGRRSDPPRSPRDHPEGRDEDRGRRSYSPGHSDAGRNQEDNGHDKKALQGVEEGSPGGSHPRWRSPRRSSGSPPGSRSRSAESLPRRSR